MRYTRYRRIHHCPYEDRWNVKSIALHLFTCSNAVPNYMLSNFNSSGPDSIRFFCWLSPRALFSMIFAVVEAFDSSIPIIPLIWFAFSHASLLSNSIRWLIFSGRWFTASTKASAPCVSLPKSSLISPDIAIWVMPICIVKSIFATSSRFITPANLASSFAPRLRANRLCRRVLLPCRRAIASSILWSPIATVSTRLTRAWIAGVCNSRLRLTSWMISNKLEACSLVSANTLGAVFTLSRAASTCRHSSITCASNCATAAAELTTSWYFQHVSTHTR